MSTNQKRFFHDREKPNGWSDVATHAKLEREERLTPWLSGAWVNGRYRATNGINPWPGGLSQFMRYKAQDGELIAEGDTALHRRLVRFGEVG